MTHLHNPELPTGVLIMWGTTTAPAGYLLCDGSAVSRTTYSNLFNTISTTFGIGDGSTTFNLPDMRQRFPIGVAAAGTGSVLGGTGGTIDHLHSIPAQTTSGPSANTAATAITGSVASNTHTHTTAATNTGIGNPPFQAVNFIIKI